MRLANCREGIPARKITGASTNGSLLARISHQMSSRDAGSVGGSKARADFPAGLGEYTLSKGK